MNLSIIRKITTGLFLFFMAFSANAQVNAPDLLCVKSDTLIWDLPSNSCGAFNSYLIYASISYSGPYNLLANITNSTQTSYFHDDTNNSTWYYYMTTDANCPGETVLSSDTLDSEAPEGGPIIFADIENGKTILEWLPSPSPEVIGYIIYKVTDIGTIPIDTVSTLSYCDENSDPSIQAGNYYVIALDPCGNTSLLINPHQTALLKGEVQSCEQSIALSWSLYQGWAGIERQEVWVSSNGEPPVLAQTLTGTDTSTFVPDLIDETNYCFVIESYDAISGASSSSNEICLTIDIIAAIRNLQIKNVTVAANNEATVTWQWNQDAELSDYSILSSRNNTDFEIIETLSPPLSLSLNNNYTDVAAMANQGPVSYKISTTDQCDSQSQSNAGTSIYLSGQASNDLKNQLHWTPFQLDSAAVSHYEVFRLENTGVNTLGTTMADEFSWSDPVDPKVNSDARVCYYVVATSDIRLASGAEEVIRSRSNTICVEQPTGILAPNAFAPAGVNYEFRPLLRFGDSADYLMTIWDRWGQKVFESNNVREGWTGRKGFHEFPQGVYTYRIRVTKASGQKVEETGTVTLLR